MFENIISEISYSLVDYAPRILGAILIFIIGWFVCKWLGNIIKMFFEKTKINVLVKRIGWQESLARVNLSLNLPKVLGEFIRWCVFILFLVVIAEILILPQFSQFLTEILGFLPNVFIALLIFFLALFAVDFSQKIFIASQDEEKINYSKILAKTLQTSIWILAILAILYQLKIVPALILSVFIAFLALIVLILGISFGVAGKDLAKKVLNELKDKLSK